MLIIAVCKNVSKSSHYSCSLSRWCMLRGFFFCSLSVIHVCYFAWLATTSSPVEGKQFVMSANILEKFTPFWLIEMMLALLSHVLKLTQAIQSETLSSTNESIWCCQQNESIPPPPPPNPQSPEEHSSPPIHSATAARAQTVAGFLWSMLI